MDAIDAAYAKNILIFAAASNYGNLADIAFPGRLYVTGKVICMFSTDANARALSSFNPSPSSAARYNFTILGEGITLPPKTDERLSGTSFAAVIGAAIAGHILDFSRHKDMYNKPRRVDILKRLKTVQGMSAVFSKMVRGAVDNRYHCMAPWKILPPQQATGDRVSERAHVCETISRQWKICMASKNGWYLAVDIHVQMRHNFKLRSGKSA